MPSLQYLKLGRTALGRMALGRTWHWAEFFSGTGPLRDPPVTPRLATGYGEPRPWPSLWHIKSH
jgi:hypothetical protein